MDSGNQEQGRQSPLSCTACPRDSKRQSPPILCLVIRLRARKAWPGKKATPAMPKSARTRRSFPALIPAEEANAFTPALKNRAERGLKTPATPYRFPPFGRSTFSK